MLPSPCAAERVRQYNNIFYDLGCFVCVRVRTAHTVVFVCVCVRVFCVVYQHVHDGSDVDGLAESEPEGLSGGGDS